MLQVRRGGGDRYIHPMRCTLVSLIAMAAISCGAGQRLLRPELAERPWLELTTPHFVVTTDLDLDDARDLAVDLERGWYGLATFYRWIAPERPLPTHQFRVIHLRSRDAFKVIRPNAAGFVTDARDYSGQRVATTFQSPEDWGRETLIHELAHIFNAHYLASAPTWLNEGLASYLSTIVIRDGVMRLGAFPAGYGQRWRRGSWVSASDLRATSYNDFHGGQRGRNYFESWKLVHMLNNTSEDTHRRFSRFLALVGQGAGQDQAWAEAFGDIDRDVAEGFRRYQQQLEIKLWSGRVDPAPELHATVRQLRAGEAHAVWMQLLLTVDGNENELKRALVGHLERARSQDPGWQRLAFWQAVVAARAEQLQAVLGDPADLLRAYLRDHERDVNAWQALVSIEMDRRVPDDHYGISTPPRALLQLEPDVLSLVKYASTPHQLNTIAWYFALVHKPRTGKAFAHRALAGSPGCGACVDTLALIEYLDGRPENAFSLQQQAINMMGDTGSEPGVQARLRHFERAAKQP